jgi:hypothetical protein
MRRGGVRPAVAQRLELSAALADRVKNVEQITGRACEPASSDQTKIARGSHAPAAVAIRDGLEARIGKFLSAVASSTRQNASWLGSVIDRTFFARRRSWAGKCSLKDQRIGRVEHRP